MQLLCIYVICIKKEEINKFIEFNLFKGNFYLTDIHEYLITKHFFFVLHESIYFTFVLRYLSKVFDLLSIKKERF